jgi:hypothetical protein
MQDNFHGKQEILQLGQIINDKIIMMRKGVTIKAPFH